MSNHDVIVHPNPDLDACVCVALAGVDPRAVHFLPAGNMKIPHLCPCCGRQLTRDERVLDHPMGEKGRLDEKTGVRHAAAVSMSEADWADPDLLDEVDEQDSTGKVVAPRFSLARIVAAIRAEAWERGMTGTSLDRHVVTVMSRIVHGINLLHNVREEARAHASHLQIVQIGKYRFALLEDSETSPEVGIVLNEEHGVAGAIFSHGNDIGVTRYPGHEQPDLRKLAPLLPGWFIHTAGFLACWGSRKSPAKCPAPQGTPRTRSELLAVMRQVFA